LVKGISFNKEKITRSQQNRQIIRGGVNVERGRGWLRAPSIESSKEIGFNKLRNRTIAKINIGLF
jgi:hypothetical protein